VVWVRHLLGAAVVVTYALIVLGGVARVSGAGPGCRGDWPLCDGRLVPLLSWETLGTAIEFGHRVAALAAGVVIVVCAVATWLRARWIFKATLLAAGLLAVQVGLGAVAARAGLSDWAAVLYLGMAMALFAALLVAYVGAYLGPADQARRLGARAQAALRLHRALALGAAGLSFVVLLLGALAANTDAMWACLELPVCHAVNDLASIQLIHRIATALMIATLVALAAQTWRLRPERGLRLAAGWVLGLVFVEAVVGLAQLIYAREGTGGLLTFWRAAHLAVGAVSWGSLVTLAALAMRTPYSVFRIPGSTTADIALQTAANTNTQHATRDTQHATRERLKDYISLTKPRVITLLIFTTVASMFITPAGPPPAALVLWTFLGGWLMSSGAHALNCYIDRDIDLLMGRTGRRPLPSNRLPASHALILGVALGALAFAILGFLVNWLAAALALAGLLYYVFVYTLWLKRTSVSNIVIGGGAGAFPPLVGWAAASGSLTLSSLFLFAIIFYWTPPHFWALALIREQDYARAGVPMLPVVAGDGETRWQILLYTLLMFMLTIMLTPLQMMGLPYMVMALALGGLFLRYVLRLLRERTAGAAWGLYRFSLLYLALLFVAMLLDRTLFA
jgi:protoheme IX farnesyltransferase